MLTIENATSDPKDNTVDKYLPETQLLNAVLKFDDNIQSAWLHTICMEIKNLVDHNTFTIIPVKCVLKEDRANRNW